MKRQLLFSLAIGLLLSACAQQPLEALTARQTELEKVTGNYARAISNVYQPRATGRGIARGTASGDIWGSDYGINYGSMGMPGYGNLFGGQILAENHERDAQNCVDQSLAVPEMDQTFDYMMADLARCLDKEISNKNPMMSYGYRNMGYNAQMNWAYLMNYRRMTTLDQFPQNDFSLLNSFANQGWY